MTYRIVVGADGSPHGNAALRWALEVAEVRNGEVTAVFCWQVPFLSFPGAFDREELEKTYKAYLIDTVSAIEPSPKVPVWTLVAEGDPTVALIKAAEDADLLVLGTRGRSAFAGLLLGSVSQGCAAGASCPVVLVKGSAEDQARFQSQLRDQQQPAGSD
ncbi:MAG TPA: universal stress protein [Streptosporangiaceae bacterium]|jgi:nucleotide-binding universal stress UspA family protein|nr:universal stress protein [Streptosporangiaceae bacterium]